MDINEAKRRCLDIITKIRPEQTQNLMDFLNQSVRDIKASDEKRIFGVKKLGTISRKLRDKTDISGNLPGEKIFWPSSGTFSDCLVESTDQVDAFLYDELDLQILRRKGVLKPDRHCARCKSFDIVDNDIISHSLSIHEVEYLFCELIPRFVDLKNKTLVDVGSRLGAVIYGALLFSPELKEIKGIEISHGHCKLQNEILKNLDKEGKTKVLAGDFRLFKEDLRAANIIIMNNVFSFFGDPQEQEKCWNEMEKILCSGTIVVHNHSIEYVTNHLKLSFKTEDWVNLVYPDSDAQRYTSDGEDSEHKFFIYQVK